jgi:hypothetical protein
MWDGTILLMSNRLVRTLIDAGVDNLDTYPALIRDTVSGQVHTDHVAVNIIGVVAAADLGRSENVRIDRTPLFDVTFDSLALRDDIPAGLRMFRMAENNSTILVHSAVRSHVVEAGIDRVQFLNPADFVRL